LRKRFYIFFVARDEAGQLRKISIPVQYLYVLLAGLAIGALCLTGIASSYARMLNKIATTTSSAPSRLSSRIAIRVWSRSLRNATFR